MLAACGEGRLADAQELAQQGDSVSVADKDGVQPMHAACYGGHRDVAEWLQRQGVWVSVADNNGRQPMHAACEGGQRDVAEWLQQQGVSVSVARNDGEQPMHAACQGGHRDMAEWLQGQGASVSVAANNGTQPMHDACEGGHLDVAEWLQQQGVSVSVAANDGWQPMHLACGGGHRNVAEWLQQQGVSVSVEDSDGWQPMHDACQNGHRDVAEWLQGQGASVSVKGGDGKQPMHAACEGGHRDVAEWLQGQGVSVSVTDFNGWQPMHYACEGGHLAVAEWLQQQGASVSVADHSGWQPMHAACKGGHLDVVQWLHGLDASLLTVKHGRSTPRSIAASKRHSKVVDWIDRQLSQPSPSPAPLSPEDAPLKELGFPDAAVDNVIKQLELKGQLLLAGPPGTGKTLLAKSVARVICGDDEGVCVVQFHPSYSYEDFISGVHPNPEGLGPDGASRPSDAAASSSSDAVNPRFVVQRGHLLELMHTASQNESSKYVLLIDELNRANIPTVFGELYSLLGSTKRSMQQVTFRDAGALEAKFGEPPPSNFPKNLFIIATMNTSDRSISVVDAALRRRFATFTMCPTVQSEVELATGDTFTLIRPYDEDGSLLKQSDDGEAIRLCEALQEINAKLDPDDRIGHSYFMKLDRDSLKIEGSPLRAPPKLKLTWQTSVAVFLDEVCSGRARLRDEIRAIEKRYGLAGAGSVTVEPAPGPETDRASDLSNTLFGQGSGEARACCHTWRMLLEEKGALIFAGPPGCGKTYAAERLAEAIAGSGNWELITFSPAYSYEEFIAGWRPVGGTFKSVDGPLLRLARDADAKPEEPHVLIIDEVNRANLAQVMGECYTLLEDRGEGVLLRSSRERRSLPPNLYIIATMNTADKSISSLDVALRRRFATVQFDATLSPFNMVLRNGLQSAGIPSQVIDSIQEFLNKVHLSADDGVGSGTKPLLGPDAQIGASFFCAAAETAQATGSPFSQVISTTWHTEIMPYVRDVLMNNSEAIGKVAQEWRRCLAAIEGGGGGGRARGGRGGGGRGGGGGGRGGGGRGKKRKRAVRWPRFDAKSAMSMMSWT